MHYTKKNQILGISTVVGTCVLITLKIFNILDWEWPIIFFPFLIVSYYNGKAMLKDDNTNLKILEEEWKKKIREKQNEK